MTDLAAPVSQIIGPLVIILRIVLGLIVARIVYELTWNRHYPPNLPTNRRLRRAIIETLRQDRAAKPGPYTIVDLGSGNGRLSWHIARRLPGAHVIGIDLSYSGNLISRLRQHLRGPGTLTYRRADFLAADLSQADAVVTYLGNKTMALIRDKLRAELKPGAIVVSNTFALGGDWQPVSVTKMRGIDQTALLVYRQGSEVRDGGSD